MGVFDFVSEAGKKLFGGGRIDESAIMDHLMSLGIEIHGLSVVAFQEERKIAVTGRVESQENREKLILAAGNVEGVRQVDDRIHVGAFVTKASEAAPADDAQEAAPEASAAEAEPAPTTENEPAPNFYTVQSGDTLSGIAKAQYGNAGLYMKIFEANQPMLTDPNKIYPGQVLRIPQDG